MNILQRKWINQPNLLEDYGGYHQVNVLYDSTTQLAYFLAGSVTSIEIPAHFLSDGWLKATPIKPIKNDS